jgi:hypothetical protein
LYRLITHRAKRTVSARIAARRISIIRRSFFEKVISQSAGRNQILWGVEKVYRVRELLVKGKL